MQNALILRRNANTFYNGRKNQFEDMPKALAYLIEKVEELDRKLESLGDASSSGKDVWMGIKELCAYLPMRPATQTVYGWTSAHLISFHKKGSVSCSLNLRLTNGS